jgi:hypothetical protein
LTDEDDATSYKGYRQRCRSGLVKLVIESKE